MIKQKIFILMFCMLTSLKLRSQEQINYTKYTSDNGLPANVIQKVLKDKRGFIWIATGAGLCRFDDYEFKYYNTSNRQDIGLNCKSINNLIEDTAGNIWFTAFPCGLFMFNTIKNEYQTIEQFGGKSLSNFLPNYSNILESDSKGNLIIGAIDTIIYFNIFSKKILKIGHESFKKGSGITDLKLDKNENLWFSINDKDLYTFHLISRQVTPIEINSLTSDIYFSAFSKGNYDWMWNISNLEYIFRTNIKTLKRDLIYDGSKKRLKINFVSELNSSELLLFLDNGMMIYDFTTKKERWINQGYFNSRDNWYVNSFLDEQNQLWVSTYSGLYKIELSTNFKKINFQQVTNNKSIELLNLNYFGNGSVLLNSLKTNMIVDENLNLSNMNPIFENVFLLRNASRTDNEAFFYDEWGNHYFYDNSKKVLTKLEFPNNETGAEYSICLKEGQNIYAFGENITCYSLISKTSSTFSSNSKGFGIFAVHKNNESGFWLGGEFEGLKYFDTKLKKITKSTFNNIKNVTDLCKKDQNQIYASTEEGLYLLNLETENVTKYELTFNETSLFINSIMKDKNDNLWLGAAEGIVYFNTKTFQYKVYTVDDGLAQNENNIMPIFHKFRNEFWFGGINGITVFNPDSIKDNQFIPNIVFTEIKYYDKKTKQSIPHLVQFPETIQNIEFTHSQNIIDFKFTALNYISTKNNQYKYRLNGFHEDWVSLGSRREITFTNLSPGRYNLQVIGSNNDGYWNEVGKSINILIRPPLWATLWAKIFYGVLFISGVYSFIKWRSNRLRKEYIKLEQKVNQRTNELKLTQEKLLRAEKMALLGEISSELHDDIGSSLTKLSLKSYILSNEATDKIQKQKIESIRAEITSMSQNLKDIVWSFNADRKGFDLPTRIKEFCNDLRESTNINIEFYDGDDAHSSSTLKHNHNLYLITKEAVNNAIKYSQCTAIKITLSGHELTINDNGIGFEYRALSTGNGLKNMKMRSEAIGGLLQIQSSNGKGTLVKVILSQ